VNNGSCGFPLVSEETVVVTDAPVMAAEPDPSSVARKVELGGDGLENCRWFAASAVFSCDYHRRHAEREN